MHILWQAVSFIVFGHVSGKKLDNWTKFFQNTVNTKISKYLRRQLFPCRVQFYFHIDVMSLLNRMKSYSIWWLWAGHNKIIHRKLKVNNYVNLPFLGYTKINCTLLTCSKDDVVLSLSIRSTRYRDTQCVGL